MSAILKTDLHVHLYGCLTAKTLWELGRDRAVVHADRMSWFASEYEKAWGRRPLWESYWKSNNGVEQLAQDYEILGHVSFARFQACFNLIIALFPMQPDDMCVLRRILSEDSQRLRGAEYRSLYPFRMSKPETNRYFTNLGHTMKDFETSRFTPRMALSIPRAPEEAERAYDHIRQWMDHTPDLARFFSGLDFCGFEEADEPLNKRSLFRRVRDDNSRRANPLSILLHVGETWESVSPLTSLRRVAEGAHSGAHRLGHATIAGVGDEMLGAHLPIRADSLSSLDRRWLASLGYQQLPGTLEATFFSEIQKQVLHAIRASEVIVESCPLSNVRIAGVKPPSAHPISRFVKEGLPVVIGRDDPGIFSSSYDEEEEFLRASALLKDETIHAFESTAHREMKRN